LKYRILNNNSLEFFDATANNTGLIAANGTNLKISANNGVIELGDTASDVQVGTLGTAINWTFLGGGTIGSGGVNTLSMGQSGDTVNMNVTGVTYQYPSNLVRYTDITATNNKINITTQVPGSIILSLPNKPVVGQLSLTDNVPTSSNTTGTLTVAGGVGISGNVYSGTLNANVGFQLGSAANGTTPIQGTVKWSGAGASPGWFGIYDSAGGKYYGIATALPATISAIGGYYQGMGVSGTTSAAGSPIFGVLSNAQSGNGLGNTSLTVYGDAKVVTFRNTLDDNRGNANVTGNLTVGNTSAVYSSTSNTTGALIVTGGVGITGNLFMSAANNYFTTTTDSSYRLGWTDNYFQRSNLYGGMSVQGAFFSLDTTIYLAANRNFIVRGIISNDTGNNTVLFVPSSPVRLQNSAPSTSNTTGSLIVGGGVGVSGNIWVGGTNAGANGVYTDVLRYAANGLPWVMGSASGGGASLSGYAANTVIVANASGFLSNSNSFFLASNNAFITGNVTASRYNLTTTETALGLFAGTSQVGYGTAIGWYAGEVNQGYSSVAVGREAGSNNQGNDAVAIGNNAARSWQGAGAIAIGYTAGGSYQAAGSIHLNANTGYSAGDPAILNAGLYIDPVRNDTGNTANAVYYNRLTRELTYAPASNSTAALAIAQGVDNSQNVRIDFSNTRMTIIEGVDVTQNTNISNKLSLTGALNQTVSGNVTIGSDLIVTGNLTIRGNISSENVQSLSVADPLIKLGIGNYTSDTKDIGFAAHYNDGTNAHTGLIRDSGTKEYYLFQGYTPELDSNNNVIITDASFRTANLNALYVKGNVITGGTNFITVSGNTTANAPTITSAGSDADVSMNLVSKGAGSINFISSGAPVVTMASGSTPFGVIASPFIFSPTIPGAWAGKLTLPGSGTISIQTPDSSSMRFGTFGGTGAGAYSGNTQFEITHTGSAVNYLSISGNTTSNGPVLSAEGTDTNIDINIRPKGIGTVNVRSSGSSTYLNVTNPTALAILNVTASGSCTRSQIITFAPGNGSEANLLIYTTGLAGNPLATAKISSTTGKSTIQVEGGQSASINIITLGATSTATANLQIRSGIGGTFSGDAGILIYGKTNSLKLMHTGSSSGSRFDMGGDSPAGVGGDFATANITSSLVDGVSSLRIIGGNRADFKLSANGNAGGAGTSGYTSFDVESIGTSTNPVYANVSSTFGGVNVQILGAQAGGFAGFANMRMFARSTANLIIESGSSGTTPGASLKIFGSGAPAYANIGSTTSIGSQVNIISSLPSTSNTTGALVVTGGVGVSGNIYVGGTNAGANGIYADNLRYAANGLPWVMGSAGGGGASLSGYTANTIVVANSSGYLSNSNSFFTASNSAMFVTGQIYSNNQDVMVTSLMYSVAFG
tara:strand:- start:3263 stop:7426 length:4164 start_codon:yes stop_codon:yes gene_type:complete